MVKVIQKNRIMQFKKQGRFVVSKIFCGVLKKNTQAVNIISKFACSCIEQFFSDCLKIKSKYLAKLWPKKSFFRVWNFKNYFCEKKVLKIQGTLYWDWSRANHDNFPSALITSCVISLQDSQISSKVMIREHWK